MFHRILATKGLCRGRLEVSTSNLPIYLISWNQLRRQPQPPQRPPPLQHQLRLPWHLTWSPVPFDHWATPHLVSAIVRYCFYFFYAYRSWYSLRVPITPPVAIPISRGASSLLLMAARSPSYPSRSPPQDTQTIMSGFLLVGLKLWRTLFQPIWWKACRGCLFQVSRGGIASRSGVRHTVSATLYFLGFILQTTPPAISSPRRWMRSLDSLRILPYLNRLPWTM